MADGEEQGSDHAHDGQARHRPVRDLRRRDHVRDEQQRREEIEQTVREDRADESPGRARPVREVTAQHGDARELPDPPGKHGVCEQPDRERGEDTVEARLRRGERLVDRQPPGERAREHGHEVQSEREHDPRPVDDVERTGHRVPVGTPPPEEDDDADE